MEGLINLPQPICWQISGTVKPNNKTHTIDKQKNKKQQFSMHYYGTCVAVVECLKYNKPGILNSN